MLKKECKYDINLLTPNGELRSRINISYELESEDGNTIKVVASICYNEKEYLGVGTDFLWTDAVADLQKKLPDNVVLKCCVACKHGNLCPVGNARNEIFCMKDIKPSQKSDIFFYTEDNTEREKRQRAYFDHCKEFEPQSKDYYTYNDFIDFLSK